MVFCGQCGSQIAPGTTRCPYCGAVSHPSDEVMTHVSDEAMHVDDPTIESTALGSANQMAPTAYATQSVYQNTPFTPPEQHKLVLRPDGVYDYEAGIGSEPTSELRPSPSYGTYPSATRPASNPGVPSSPYSTFAPQADYPNSTYVPTQVAPLTPDYHSLATPMNDYGNNAAYPQYQQQEQYRQYPSAQPAAPLYPAQPIQRKRSRIPVLLTILLILVAVLGGLVFYALRHTSLTGNTSGGSGTSQTTTPMTPADHAKAVVQQYYADVNNKNYHDAYYLWKRDANSQTYTSFVQGYNHTVHDDLTINSVVNSSSTIRVNLTIVATENANGSTVQHTYSGYYLVGQVNGVWKIVKGYLVQV